MTEVLLVAHGKLAQEMKNSAEMIFGKLPEFYTIDFLKEDGFDSIKENISVVLNQMSDSVIVVSDLFAGTPYNACCGLAMEYRQKNIEVISGMSLPLVLETASMCGNKTPKEIGDYLLSICSDTVRTFLVEEDDDEEDL